MIEAEVTLIHAYDDGKIKDSVILIYHKDDGNLTGDDTKLEMARYHLQEAISRIDRELSMRARGVDGEMRGYLDYFGSHAIKTTPPIDVVQGWLAEKLDIVEPEVNEALARRITDEIGAEIAARP